ncbi:MAG: class I SAM-dependent methyltransferase, partial [Ferrovibrio sp.]|uniref:methyltransferase domain-containing protein n=1 Tax=Ferrovibrio sp. TaxID=1917215 RepID=UPI002623FD48
FPDNSFDIVVNIESSHCYADVPAFAREVSRVLAPGGWFTFADMRSKTMLDELETQLAVPGLVQAQAHDISLGVVAALDAAEARKRKRIGKAWLMRPFLTEFAGAKNSMLYQALAGQRVIYTARRYQKIG